MLYHPNCLSVRYGFDLDYTLALYRSHKDDNAYDLLTWRLLLEVAVETELAF